MSNNAVLDVSRFWQYSYHRYSQPGNAEQLLSWQQTYGINVNLLLFTGYCQRHRLAQDSQLWRQLAQRAEGVNTAQFREQRRHWQRTELTPLAEQQLKQHLLAAELLFERREQQLIVDTYRHYRGRFDQQLEHFWDSYGIDSAQLHAWLAENA
ncbi:DUF2390 domain-containing protein [Idiomarina xiamenensis]|uniref:TIGR02444 family protein n=1 Tax=Idiomarina xiamenensis 10-D-4 TaxID=740709 RepID=K2KV99_9GAMM|nr:DUF2390 domain-containing protein [Idiomarina xiamenensis]EKE81540.1 hypothetical protein A10D4_10696 [Idiomarina xiamenensis 10-D-4]